MARHKPIDTNRRLLPVNLAAQLLPGSFKHAVDHLLESILDLSHFDVRFTNDATGTPAQPPADLLKVVFCAYAREVVSSRAVARLCEKYVTFIALCGARTPLFTTNARFVSTLGPDIAPVFAAVLTDCDQQGLIGVQNHPFLRRSDHPDLSTCPRPVRRVTAPSLYPQVRGAGRDCTASGADRDDGRDDPRGARVGPPGRRALAGDGGGAPLSAEAARKRGSGPAG